MTNVGEVFLGGGLEQQHARKLEQQYETAKAASVTPETCVYAGAVVAAWVRANDVAKVRYWKKTNAATARAPSLYACQIAHERSLSPPRKRRSHGLRCRSIANGAGLIVEQSLAD
jgi:hypothetical protein